LNARRFDRKADFSASWHLVREQLKLVRLKISPLSA
jgi:hypothetical protein